MKIVSVEEMRALEAQSEAAGVPTAELMLRAGLAVAREVRRALGGAAGRRVLVLVGPGNNGGDGLVAARHLASWGAKIDGYLLAPRREDDPELIAALESGIRLQRSIEEGDAARRNSRDGGAGGGDPAGGGLEHDLRNADLVLDAVLGTGRSRPLGGLVKEAFDLVRRAKARRPALRTIALDIPSGLDADSGAVDPSVFPADQTLTLGFPKQGLYRGPAVTAAGQVTVLDIGIPAGYARDIVLELITRDTVQGLLPERPVDANKGTFGRVLVIAGSGNFIGAAILACRGAHRSGAGLVTLAAPAPLVTAVAGSLVETTYLPLPATQTGAIATMGAALVRDRVADYDAVAIGCGLGQEEETKAFVASVLFGGGQAPALRENLPVVLDADALNILAKTDRWWSRLRVQAVLTPHPGEMARLLRSTTKEVQRDRIAAARGAASTWGQTVVLKGAYTVIAAQGGLARVSPFAVPALASAGTGDVLTGVVAGLMAQGLEPYEAATVGVFLHGRAGQRFTQLHGDTGLVATDLLAHLPDMIREIRGPRGA